MKDYVLAFVIKRHALLTYGLVALLILWPLLTPGYILTLDMVFTPKLPMPETLTSSYLLHAGLHLLNVIIPSDVIEKGLLFCVLFFSGLGMHMFVYSLKPASMRIMAQGAAYASGLLYMINPFTYERFMAGQYSVLLGYACLPFFALVLLRFLKKQSLLQAALLTLWMIIISIVSIHTVGLAVIISVIATLQAVWKYRADASYLKKLAMYIAGISLAFFMVSIYWLLPLLQGNGSTAASIATFQATDQSVFVTNGEGLAGKLVHIVRLEGFWGEERDLFLLPQDETRIWGLSVLVVWSLVVIGAVSVWRQKREVSVLFLCLVSTAAILATGIGIKWLSTYIPLFAGYREPQKFVAIVAFCYAVFVGFAIPEIMKRVSVKYGRLCIAVVLVCSLIGFTPVMFQGFDGQLVPRQYPPDWYTMNAWLDKDTVSYKVLFLPWHLYTRYQFSGRVIANPGNSFFGKSLIVSNNPELGDVGPAIPDLRDSFLTSNLLPQALHTHTLGHQLASLNIKYVLLSKNDDYQTYDYLNHQSDLHLVIDSATLKLYRNNAYVEHSK